MPLTGIIVALLIKDFETAAVLAFVISLEQPLVDMAVSAKKRHANLSAARQTPFVRLLDKASLPFFVMTLLIAGGVWLATDQIGRFLEVIASASAVPLILTAPLVITAGIKKLKLAGIQLSSAAVIERTHEVKTLIVKKSGVLTDTIIEVSSVTAYSTFTKTDVIRVASALAASSDHAVAKAIIAHSGPEQKSTIAKHAQETTGQGVSGRMKGASLHMGRLSYLESMGVNIPPQAAKTTKTSVFVAMDTTMMGVIEFNEHLLPDAKRFAQKLGKLGIAAVELVSGTSQKSTDTIAKAAGIASAHGNMTASGIIRLFDEKTPLVAFVGSDVSDEPAATAADLSIATTPLPGFDITIDEYTPDRLLLTIKTTRQIFRLAQVLSVTGLLATLGLIIIAATGILQPIQAAMLNGVVGALSIIMAGIAIPKQNQ